MADSQSETVNDVPQEETAVSLIESVSARLDSTIRFCIIMGDRLADRDEAPIFYTFLNVLEPIRETVTQAVEQMYRSKSSCDPVRGGDPSEMRAMAARAWQERGIVILGRSGSRASRIASI